MNVAEYFDPYNMEHLLAYRFLKENGKWPEGFIPQEISDQPVWSRDVRIKMTEAWIEQVLAGNVIGMPPIEYTEVSVKYACDSCDQSMRKSYPNVIDIEQQIRCPSCCGSMFIETEDVRDETTTEFK